MQAITHRFFFKPSIYLSFIVLAFHGIVAGTLFFIPLPLPSRMLLLLLLIVSAVYFLLKDARLSLPSAWVEMRFENEQVVLINRKREEAMAQLLSSSFVSPHLVLLNFKLIDRRAHTSVALMSDSLSEENARTLRQLLKWRALPID